MQDPLPNSVQSESDNILLISKDGASVPFPLSVLLAVSPLLRDTIRDTACLCSTNISFPFVDLDILCLVAEVLRQGESTSVMPVEEASTCVVKAQAVIDQLQIDASIGLNRSSDRVGSSSLLISNVESKSNMWNALIEPKVSESLNNNEVSVGQMCYTCSFCWKDFELKMEMYKHVKMEHPETTHACTSCGSRFIHQNNLDNHIKDAHPIIEQVTVNFDIKAESASDQRESMDKIWKLPRKCFPCDFCEKVFTQRSSLRRHMVKRHSLLDVNAKKGKKVHNKYKEENSRRKPLLEAQIQKQGRIKDEQVSIQSEVDVKSETVPDQNLSMDKSSKMLKKFFPCDFCEKVFTQSGNMRRHMGKRHCLFDVNAKKGKKVHNKSKEDILRRNLLMEAQIQKQGKIKDEQVIQRDVDVKSETVPDQNLSMDKSSKMLKKFFPCDFCEKVFTQSCNRRRHMVKRHCLLDYNVNKGRKVDDMSKEEKVKRKTSRKTQILKQGKIKEEESKPLVTKSSLSLSGQVKRFKCSECLRVFSTVRNLKIHKAKSNHLS